MKTSKHLDWLSITVPNSANWRQFIPFADLVLTGKGRHGYGQAWTDRRTGARLETASARDDMGTHLTLSGDVLNAMRDELGAVDDAIVRRIQEYDSKCSRVDLAIDCYGVSFTPEDLETALLTKQAKIKARTWRFIDGHRNGISGATLDTGSVKSDVRFRFYDKRAEQGIKDGEAWVRLELQLRRLYAQSTIGACLEYGTSLTVSAKIGNYLAWSNTEYQTAIAGDTLVFPAVKRKLSKRQHWLLNQVASALADECYVDPYFYEKFVIAWHGFLERKQRLDR